MAEDSALCKNVNPNNRPKRACLYLNNARKFMSQNVAHTGWKNALRQFVDHPAEAALVIGGLVAVDDVLFRELI